MSIASHVGFFDFVGNEKEIITKLENLQKPIKKGASATNAFTYVTCRPSKIFLPRAAVN